MRHIFPLRTEIRSEKRRHTEKYIVEKANTDRLNKIYNSPYAEDPEWPWQGEIQVDDI